MITQWTDEVINVLDLVNMCSEIGQMMTNHQGGWLAYLKVLHVDKGAEAGTQSSNTSYGSKERLEIKYHILKYNFFILWALGMRWTGLQTKLDRNKTHAFISFISTLPK